MNKWQKIMDESFKAMEAIRKKAEAENRAMTPEELTERESLRAKIDAAKKEWDDFKAEELYRAQLYGDPANGGGALTIAGERIEVPDQPIYRGSPAAVLGMQLRDIRTMANPNAGHGEISEARSRLDRTEKRNREHHNIQKKVNRGEEGRAAATGGFTIGIPSDGGYFLQGETSRDLMTAGFNNSVVLSRTSNRTLSPGFQFVETYYIDESSRATGSRGGGVRVYTAAELDQFTASKTKWRPIRIEPKKLTGLYYASGEMVENVTFLGQEMRDLFGKEFAFKGQDLVIRGTGAGEALGILNAPCLISVPKENGQLADTVVTKNILKMESRLWQENPGVCYLINRETKPQLSLLTIDIGTGGVLAPLYKQEFYQGVMQASLNGFPCFTIEQAAALGDAGDVMLVDLSEYVTANKGDINEAMSIHVEFIYHQNTYRFLWYFDGQPKKVSPITPYKGSATVGPFLVIAAR